MSKYHNELKSIIHNIDFSNFWLMHFFLKGVKYRAGQSAVNGTEVFEN